MSSSTIMIMKNRSRISNAFLRYMNHPVVWSRLLRTKPESYWIKRGERMVLQLFAKASIHVPAYARFLKTRLRHPSTITSMRAFQRVPVIDKDSYLRTSSLPELCWDGNLAQSRMVISSTSGSSGEPFYFPRTSEQDLQYAALAEMYLRSNFLIHRKSTLYIVGWGMGVWIGGVFSYSSVRIVAERGKYDLSIITPGTNQDEILKAVQTLGPYYDQVIIGGYPPMIKDLVDEGNRRNISWKKYHTKFIFSAEGFSEQFRDYICTQTDLKNPYRDTLNHYGTVDLGTMAHETPLTILIRRLARTNTALNMDLFGDPHRQPTLAQYIPELFYFEEYKGGIICTAQSGLPLVRYDLKDIGGVKSFKEIHAIFEKHGILLSKEIARVHIEDTVWNVPFVFVFERSDFTVKLSGANIYPEEIRRVLEDPQIARFVTGKCTIRVDVDEHMDQYLMVHVELKRFNSPEVGLKNIIQDRIVYELLQYNSEYAYLYKNLPIERMAPRVTLWPFGDAMYFGAPGKHRWVRK